MSDTKATTHESSVSIQRQSAATTASSEGTAYWFFGALAVIRSPEGALPIIIEMAVPRQPVIGPPMTEDEAAMIDAAAE